MGVDLGVIGLHPLHSPSFVKACFTPKHTLTLMGLWTSLLVTNPISRYNIEYGILVDATHEYCFIWENIVMESLKRFMQAIWELFKFMYLKQPTQEYMEHQLQINATWGWSKMFIFLDCKRYY